MSIHLKKIASWILAVLLFIPASVSYAEDHAEPILELGTTPIVTNAVFRDVGNHWAANAIYNMAQYSIVNGYDDATFKPGNSITREEFAALLARSFSLEWNTGNRVSTYTDIQPDRWSVPYIEAVRGIYPDPALGKGREYMPTTPVTREEFAAALVRILGYNGPQQTDPAALDSTFRDAGQIAEEYRNAVSAAVEMKLIQGQANRMFAPKASITRAEVASIMYRVVLLTEETTGQIPQITLPVQIKTNVFEVNGTVEAGSEVVLNGQKLPVENGAFRAQLRVLNEGAYNIVIAIRSPSANVQIIRKKLVYERAVPQISLYSFSETATKNKINLAGKVSYEATNTLPDMYVNGEKVNVLRGGDFNKDVSLEEGVNEFRFKAIASDGRNAELTKEILFTPPAPVLTVNSIPSSTKSKTITVTGNVKDVNDEDAVVYMDGQMVEPNVLGVFSKQLSLTEGKNTIVITAQNKYAKVSTVVKIIEVTESK
jgi:hypothetical protein